jgi:hypothetical protein
MIQVEVSDAFNFRARVVCIRRYRVLHTLTDCAAANETASRENIPGQSVSGLDNYRVAGSTKLGDKFARD